MKGSPMESRLSRLEAVQTVLLEIGQRSSSCGDIREFLQAVHAALGRLMYAANFYVALHDVEDGSVRFAYFVDEVEPAPDPEQRVALAAPEQSPTAWVILNRRPLLRTAQGHTPRQAGSHAWSSGNSAEHWMGCPLLDQQQQALGAMVIQSYDAQHTFYEEDQALFALIASHVSSALQGLQSVDRLERAVRERTALLAHEVAERRRAERMQHALYELADLSATASAGGIDLLYQRLHQIVAELLTAENFLIALFDPDSGEIAIPYSSGRVPHQALADGVQYGTLMGGYVLARREPCLLNADEYAMLAEDGLIESAAPGCEPCSWMGAPMQLGERAYGVIVVQSYDPGVLYGAGELEILAFMANHVAVAIARIQADREMRRAKATLEEQNASLSAALVAVQEAQEELVRQEKLASLGRLVAGVAHEINTPLGICVTATSHLVQELKLTREDLEAGQLDEPGLRQFFDIIEQSLRILTSNTQRAAALVKSFKQVAVDQSSENVRSFNLRNYLDEVLLSLQPKLKGKPVKVHIDCPPDILVRCFPGALSQIVTNLVINSLLHGFDDGAHGNIEIAAAVHGETVQIDYSDNGAGMDAATLGKLFDPFFTTKRGQGGSGLGGPIIYNLVTGALGGTLKATSAPGQGLQYEIRFPLTRK
jgi:signal transduction histidine kinase